MRNEMLRVLRNTRELFTDPNHWTQQVYARNADGEEVDFDDEEACS